MPDYNLIIDGKKVATAETFPVINPATEEVIAHCPKATVEHVDEAVAAARRAFPAWSATPDAERSQLVHAIADALEAHSEELTKLLTLEQGKPGVGFAGMGGGFEIGGTLAWAHATADLELPVEVIQDNDEARIEVHRKPLGVVGSITPWNFPLMIAIWHTMPALRSGNTVVIKPSEFTPLTTLRAVEIINDILPPGVFNIVTGDGSLGAAISNHPDIDKIVFTGSTPTGKKIMECAAGSLKRLTLELGGNAPFIVFDDANLDKAVEGAMASEIRWTGQTCVCVNRFLVQDSIHDAVVEKLKTAIEAMKVGDGLEDGVSQAALINRDAADKVMEHLEDALGKGAKVVTGGQRHQRGGNFVQPTLITGVTTDAQLCQEETFGPLAAVIPFRTEEDAKIGRAPV